MPSPLYTPDNCEPAYQLRWSLVLFSETPLPPAAEWFEVLQQAVEPDGVRILEQQLRSPGTWLFLLSTKPHVAPPGIVKSVKGRLQHAIGNTVPKAFRRNFRLTSVGDATLEVVEDYVAGQLGHHPIAEERVERTLQEFQQVFPGVDLRTPQRSAHGEYVYNLHVVLVHAERWRETCRERLQSTRNMILASASRKGHRLSRLALLSDHLHFTMGCPYDSSPEKVALGYLNNVAYAHGMVQLFSFSYYVGTVGGYDMDAIRRS